MAWVEGFSRRPVARRGGLTFRRDVPLRFTVHSTEGPTIEGALGAYDGGTGCPHFTVEFGRDIKLQHVPISLGAYALRNESGGVETNAIPNIQIEWVGYARDGRNKSSAELKWFGRLLADIALEAQELGLIDAGFELVWPEFYDDRSGFTLATKNAKQRSTFAEWYSGRWTLYGHQHVPENTHWDPGIIDWAVVDSTFEANYRKTGPKAPLEPSLPAPPAPPFTLELPDNVAQLAQAQELVRDLKATRQAVTEVRANLRTLINQAETLLEGLSE